MDNENSIDFQLVFTSNIVLIGLQDNGRQKAPFFPPEMQINLKLKK